MKQGYLILLAVFLTLHVEASDTRDAFDNLIKPVFQENCTKCHGEKGKVKGKLNLLKINALPKFQEDAERIKKIITAIEDGEMPPEEETPIPESKKKLILAELKALLKVSILETKSFARTPIRRPRLAPDREAADRNAIRNVPPASQRPWRIRPPRRAPRVSIPGAATPIPFRRGIQRAHRERPARVPRGTRREDDRAVQKQRRERGIRWAGSRGPRQP